MVDFRLAWVTYCGTVLALLWSFQVTAQVNSSVSLQNRPTLAANPVAYAIGLDLATSSSQTELCPDTGGRSGFKWFWDDQRKKCRKCPKCNRGSQPNQDCGNGIGKGTECEDCPEGSYSDEFGYQTCKKCDVVCENVVNITLCTRFHNHICGECKPGFFRDGFGNCENCQVYDPPDPDCVNRITTDIIQQTTSAEEQKTTSAEEEAVVKTTTGDRVCVSNLEYHEPSSSQIPAAYDVEINAEEGKPGNGAVVVTNSSHNLIATTVLCAFALIFVIACIVTVVRSNTCRWNHSRRRVPGPKTKNKADDPENNNLNSSHSDGEVVEVDVEDQRVTYIKESGKTSEDFPGNSRDGDESSIEDPVELVQAVEVNGMLSSRHQQQKGTMVSCFPKAKPPSEYDSAEKESDPLLSRRNAKERGKEKRRHRHGSNNSTGSQTMLGEEDTSDIVIDTGKRKKRRRHGSENSGESERMLDQEENVFDEAADESHPSDEKTMPNNTSSRRMASLADTAVDKTTLRCNSASREDEQIRAKQQSEMLLHKQKMEKLRQEKYDKALALAKGKQIEDLLNDIDKTDDIVALLTPPRNPTNSVEPTKYYPALLPHSGIDRKYWTTINNAREIFDNMQKTMKHTHDMAKILEMHRQIDRGDVVDELCAWIVEKYGSSSTAESSV